MACSIYPPIDHKELTIAVQALHALDTSLLTASLQLQINLVGQDAAWPKVYGTAIDHNFEKVLAYLKL